MRATDIVTLSMGRPIQAPVLIPVIHSSTPNCINEPIMINGKIYGLTCISFGTPYGAVIVEDVESVDVSETGAALGTHALFPKGASIVFIQVIDKDKLHARLWQRGEGESAFSVEAACVAATVSMMVQKILTYEVDVMLGGHSVHVKWDRGGDDVSITGPTEVIQV